MHIDAPEDYVIQTALNMDTDTAESIIAGLPNILAAVTVPLLILSYIAVFFMTKHTMRSVRAMTDNGPGFGEDMLQHIFERFYRGDAAHTRGAGGAGLGLSIAASIMYTLGGSIRAENNQGKGACIILQLP